MDNTVPRKEDRGIAGFCVLLFLILAIVWFSLGAVLITRHQKYHNVATGKLIGIHVEVERDSHGGRYFHLVEKYNIAEKEFNCSIANLYEGRTEAENDMARHVTEHAQRSLHYHGTTCMTVSDWTFHRIAAVSLFIMASVALSLIACCVPLAVHEYHMEASEHAPVGATNAERGEPVAVQMTELIGCSLSLHT
jgi:hypothetical protein